MKKEQLQLIALVLLRKTLARLDEKIAASLQQTWITQAEEDGVDVRWN